MKCSALLWPMLPRKFSLQLCAIYFHVHEFYCCCCNSGMICGSRVRDYNGRGAKGRRGWLVDFVKSRKYDQLHFASFVRKSLISRAFCLTVVILSASMVDYFSMRSISTVSFF